MLPLNYSCFWYCFSQLHFLFCFCCFGDEKTFEAVTIMGFCLQEPSLPLTEAVRCFMLACKRKNVERTADLEGCFCLSSPNHIACLAVLAGRDCKDAEHTGNTLCFEREHPRLSQSQVLFWSPCKIPSLHISQICTRRQCNFLIAS